MSTITTIQGTDIIANSRADINTNFSNLNTDKIETSTLDTDTALTANSDSKIATQKAVKAYVLANVNPTGPSWNEYATGTSGTDSYVITLTGVAVYVTGQTFKFKADVANTGACSLNVNGLGAKTIKKSVTTDLATGDILANQLVTVTYDGTNMQLVASLAPGTDVQTFLTNGTYTKPSGTPKKIFAQAWGGGGSGGAGANRGGGGGGGAYIERWFEASDFGATETITIGAGGAAQATDDSSGNVGGNTTVGSLMTAYGGGGGFGNGTAGTGGGGGGQRSVGLTGNVTTGGTGGSPIPAVGGTTTSATSVFGGAAGGAPTFSGGESVYGGGGGSGSSGSAGGNSIYGGGGGGSNTGANGGVSIFGGNGGAGNSGTNNASPGVQPGGGGGASATGTSGAGGDGKVIITTFF